jgi:hypothetical protein
MAATTAVETSGQRHFGDVDADPGRERCGGIHGLLSRGAAVWSLQTIPAGGGSSRSTPLADVAPSHAAGVEFGDVKRFTFAYRGLSY